METNRILLVRPCALGDFVLTLPVVYALKRVFPDSEVVLLGKPSHRELAPQWISSALDYSSSEFTPLFGTPTEELRELLGGFGLAIVYLPDDGTVEGNLEACGVRKVIVHFPRREGKGHFVEELLRGLVGLCKCSAYVLLEPKRSDGGVEILEPRCEGEVLQKWFREFSAWNGGRRVVVHPGSGSGRKCWMIERFAELIERVEAEVVLGPAERELAGKLSLGREPIMPRSLRELREILLGASAFVGNDSGVSHLASALGVPSVVVFGPTDAERWSPLGLRVRVIRGRCEERCSTTCASRYCLESIAVDDVSDILEEVRGGYA